MSKWRPAPLNCLYVIPDVHGRYNQLKLIFNRIFPLRKSDGGKDRLIMLGDYIDRHPDSHKVIDLLIETKKKYKDQLILIRGNHERMLFDAMKESRSSANFLAWMHCGGEQTYSGYLKRANQYKDNPYVLPRSRLRDFIPKEHKKFLENELVDCYEHDGYIFAHGGYDPCQPSHKQDKDVLHWGSNNLYPKYRQKHNKPFWQETIVLGHHWSGPYISDKLMMFDAYMHGLIVVELRSMEAFIARKSKSKLVKLYLDKFVS